MGKCAVCKAAHQKDCGRTYHRFPQRDPKLLQKWVDNINKGTPGSNWKLGKDTVLCSDHFDESCFDRTGFRVHLNKNSVPTIFSEAYCSACKKTKSQWPELPFHKFPVKDPALLGQWVEKIKLDSSTPVKNSLLCSDHFEKSCLVKCKGKIRLRQGSIPTRFETTKKRKVCTALDEVHDYAASVEHRPLTDSIRSTRKKIKCHIIDDVTFVSARCGPNTAEAREDPEIIDTLEICDSSVHNDIGEVDLDDDIPVRSESQNSNRLDPADSNHEQSITGTPNSKRDDVSEISSPEIRARLFAHDHHYFDSPDTLSRKLATARKALSESKKVVRSQQKRLMRMRRKITALQEVVSLLRDKDSPKKVSIV